MSITSRHHYLPQFFLKGFTGDDDRLAVFDIKKNELNRERYSPKRIFFEFDRNTVYVNGEPDDFIEKRYSFIESQIAPTFKRLHLTKDKIDVDYKGLQNIILFVGYTYWRIPQTDETIKEFINKSTSKELRFSIRNTKDDSEAPHELYRDITQRPAFIGLYRIMKPIIDYLEYSVDSGKDWQIYFPSEANELHLISDNPIIFKDDKDNKDDKYENIFDKEFIMPLTSGKTLYHTAGKKVSIIQPEDTMKVDLLVFLQAKKYVAGPDPRWLNVISTVASTYKQDSSVERLKEEVFSVFS